MCEGWKVLLEEEKNEGISIGKTEERKESLDKLIRYFINNGRSEEEAIREADIVFGDPSKIFNLSMFKRKMTSLLVFFYFNIMMVPIVLIARLAQAWTIQLPDNVSSLSATYCRNNPARDRPMIMITKIRILNHPDTIPI